MSGRQLVTTQLNLVKILTNPANKPTNQRQQRDNLLGEVK